MELRANTIQLAGGVLQPLVLSALSQAYMAKTTHTYAVPPLGQFGDVMHMFRSLGGNLKLPLAVIVGVNLIFAAKMTYEQEKASIRLNHRLRGQLMQARPAPVKKEPDTVERVYE
jgi:hypothetical protein